MQRRDFLRIASAAGVGIPTWALLPEAQAQSAVYTGKILINVYAEGGLDQSSWADPRETDPAQNNYAADQVLVIPNGIVSAPILNLFAMKKRAYWPITWSGCATSPPPASSPPTSSRARACLVLTARLWNSGWRIPIYPSVMRSTRS